MSADVQQALALDDEEVKSQAMLCALRGKFALEPYRSDLLLTHPRPLAENSQRARRSQ